MQTHIFSFFSTATALPASKIWPPPLGADYMKSVKELPSSIRLIGDDNESSTIQGQGDIDDKGNMNQVKNNIHVPVPVSEHDQKMGAFPIQFGFWGPNTDIYFQSTKTEMDTVSGQMNAQSGQSNLEEKRINTEIKSEGEFVHRPEEVTEGEHNHDSK